jgi:adenylate cyclase
MARISLKHVLNKETSKLVLQLMEALGNEVSVEDAQGEQLLGTLPQSGSSYLIKTKEQTYGQVNGPPALAKPLADIIQHLLQQEIEKKALNTEIQNLNREISLINDFSEKLAASIDPSDVAQMALAEAFRLNRASCGWIVLLPEHENTPLIFAHIGKLTPFAADLGSHRFLRGIIEKGQAGIISGTSGIKKLKQIDETLKALMFAPLQVKHRLVGAIFLACDQPVLYSKAELKLLTTLALQTAVAIESSLLFEKGIKESQQREESIRRIHEASARFVPNEFVRALGYQNITEVTLGDNVEKEVTVFFNDIRGYTTLAETMTPAENFNFVNAFHGRMGPLVEQYGGFINQYLGDAIMALFTQNPVNALRAAIGMQLVLQTYNQERSRKNRIPIHMGIGIHTGPLIMGIIGDQNRLDAATIADSVNTSSRIESLTKHFGVSILLSEESLKKIDAPQAFKFRYLGKVQVKGKNEPIGIYECFDGDTPELQEMKSKTLADFEKGLTSYYKRDFYQAADAFNKVLRTNPNDHPTRLFLYKAIGFNNEKVEDDWNGVEVITFK